MVALKFGLTISGMPDVLGQSRRAEALGFDSIWTGEHIVWRSPTNDGLVAMMAAAAVTERIRIGTSILLVPLKHPVLICKAVTTLDQISQGRFSLGVGIGGEYPKEFEAVGIPVSERGPRMDESLALMKRLWTEENVTHNGHFFKFEDVTLEPKPVQKPHPPIIVAGRQGSIKRTARFGDGWMPYMYTPEMYRDGWAKIEEMSMALGRNPTGIEKIFFGFITIGDSYEASEKRAAQALGGRYGQDFRSIARKYAIFGTPQQCAERIAEYRDAGAEHFILSPAGYGDDIETYPEIIAGDIVPLLRSER